ncbi:MAG: hypothetical protein K5989_07470, partial [Lachnospiraceae bacterium]|nr:hypothetical protein [Lachnospiraceae bacterium]
MTDFLKRIQIKPSIPFPLGSWVDEEGIHISVEYRGSERLSLILFDLEEKEERHEIPFPQEAAMGAVYSMTLSGISCRKYAYLFKAGHHEFMDPHATRTTGNEQWGKNKA